MIEIEEEKIIGKRIIDMLMNEKGKRKRENEIVIEIVGKKWDGRIGKLKGKEELGKMGLKLKKEIMKEMMNERKRKREKRNDGIKKVEELRSKKKVDRLNVVELEKSREEEDRRFRNIRRERIGSNDENEIEKVDIIEVMVGKRKMINKMKKNVEKVGMRIIDLVEKKKKMRMMVKEVGKKKKMIEEEIEGRRENKKGKGVKINILRNIKEKKIKEERDWKLIGKLSIEEEGGEGKKIGKDRIVRIEKKRKGKIDRRRKRIDRKIMKIEEEIKLGLKMRKKLLIVIGKGIGRDEGNSGDGWIDLIKEDGIIEIVLRKKNMDWKSLVYKIDWIVRKFEIRNIKWRKIERRFDGIKSIFEIVKVLKIRIKEFNDIDSIRDRRIVKVDIMEEEKKGNVIIEEMEILIIGGREDEEDREGRERRIKKVWWINWKERSREREDKSMNLIDEKKRERKLIKLIKEMIKKLLKIEEIEGEGKKSENVEREDGRIRKWVRKMKIKDEFRKKLGNRSFEEKGIEKIKRIVIGEEEKKMNSEVYIDVKEDKRVDKERIGILVEIDEIGRKRIMIIIGRLIMIDECKIINGDLKEEWSERINEMREIGNEVGDIVEGVVKGNMMIMKEVGRMDLKLRKDGEKKIRESKLVKVGRMKMDKRKMDKKMERGCRFGIIIIEGDEIVKIEVNIVSKDMIEIIKIKIEGENKGERVMIVDKRKKKMLEGGILVVKIVWDGEGMMKRNLKDGGERWNMK